MSSRKIPKGRLNSLECPYSEHKYRCKNKKWCVAHPSHCAYQSYDILARNKKLTKAFRRPKIIDRCQQSTGICRVCVDEWFFDTIADILDERKQLKSQKENIPKKEYKARKKELMVKFEELGDEYEGMMQRCDDIDEKSGIESSITLEDTTEEIEEDPSSFRDMLSAALTRQSAKKRTPKRLQMSLKPSVVPLVPLFQASSDERSPPIRLSPDLEKCTGKSSSECRECVDDWYEREFERQFSKTKAAEYLQMPSFKKLGRQYSAALDRCSF